MKVAFLGLGAMGRHMARNVLAAGHEPTPLSNKGSDHA